jgi:hypothetical protein
LTLLLPLCADGHANWEPNPPGTLKACKEIALPLALNMSRENYHQCPVVAYLKVNLLSCYSSEETEVIHKSSI